MELELVEPKKLTPAEVRAAIQEICKKHNYDPFEELIRLAKEVVEIEIKGKKTLVPVCDVEQRISIAKELAPYIAPKLRNLEVKSEVDGDININVRRFTDSVIPIPDKPLKQLVAGAVNEEVLDEA